MAKAPKDPNTLELGTRVCFFGQEGSGISHLVEGLAQRSHERRLIDTLGMRTASTVMSHDLPRGEARVRVTNYLEIWQLSPRRELTKARRLYAKGAAASVVIAAGPTALSDARFWLLTARELDPTGPRFLWVLDPPPAGAEAATLAADFEATLATVRPSEPQGPAEALRAVSETICRRWLDRHAAPKRRRRGGR